MSDDKGSHTPGLGPLASRPRAFRTYLELHGFHPHPTVADEILLQPFVAKDEGQSVEHRDSSESRRYDSFDLGTEIYHYYPRITVHGAYEEMKGDDLDLERGLEEGKTQPMSTAITPPRTFGPTLIRLPNGELEYDFTPGLPPHLARAELMIAFRGFCKQYRYLIYCWFGLIIAGVLLCWALSEDGQERLQDFVEVFVRDGEDFDVPRLRG